MLSHAVYVTITWETAAMDTPNKVTVLVTDAPAKCTPTMSSLKTQSPVLQYSDTSANEDNSFRNHIH